MAVPNAVLDSVLHRAPKLFSAFNYTELPTIASLEGHFSAIQVLLRHAGTFSLRLQQPVVRDFLSIRISSVPEAVAEEVER